MVAALRTDAGKGEEQVAGLLERRTRFTGRRMRAAAVKIFADGVIESGTAAVLQPYLNRGGSRGELNFEPERLTRLVTRLDPDAGGAAYFSSRRLISSTETDTPQVA